MLLTSLDRSEYRPELVPACQEAEVTGWGAPGADSTEHVRLGVGAHSLTDLTSPEFPAVVQRALLVLSGLRHMEVVLKRDLER